MAWTTEGDRRPEHGFRVLGAHTDSPNLRVKPRPDTGAAGLRQLGVEVYGGALLNSWLDRDLGLSGRVAVRVGDTVELRLFRIDRPLLRIPQLAIHLDRGVNENGLKLNPQQHLAPLWATGPVDHGGFRRFLADELAVGPDDIVAWDAMAHDVMPAALLGVDDEFVSAPRIDNLASCFTALRALERSLDHDHRAIPVVCLFDHEEVGSQSAQGADSTMLPTVLERVAATCGAGRDGFHRALAASLCLSADGAHATNPNYAERHEPAHQIALNGGPVLKLNSNVRYATDAGTGAIVALAARTGAGAAATVRGAHRHALRLDHRADHRRPPRHPHRRCGHPPAGDALGPRAVRSARPGPVRRPARRRARPGPAVSHPLDALSAAEIRLAADLYRQAKGDADPLFVSVRLVEPTRDELATLAAGGAVPKRARVVAIAGPCALGEAVVSLDDERVESLEVVEPARPPVLFEEAIIAIAAVKEHADWQAAMRRRGIDDFDLVQLDPWPPGTFGEPHEEGRRLTKVLSYLRTAPDDNGYARPIEGVLVHVDLGTGEVLFVEDRGVVPIPPESGSYYPEHHEPLRDDLKPLDITQPDGPSFTVEGNLVRWQRWQLRVTLDPIEGLVLHQVGYEDDGRVRPIMHRASLSEMVVPYGATDPMHRWKNAFDAGEWGMGRMTNSLELGCDCLGEIYYFDAALVTEHGDANVINNAICMHEEDFGIVWKHLDMHSFRTEVRRQRRLVVSSIYTVGNYEYGFYWYFYLDGSIQLEVKLTGIIQPIAFDPEVGPPANANVIAPGFAAPHHQHLFCMRLDMAVDGFENSVVEVNTAPQAPGPDNEWLNGIEADRHPARERAASAARRRRGQQSHLASRQPRRTEPAGRAGRLQADPAVVAHPAGRSPIVGRPPGRLRPPQPVGHAVP